MESKKRKKPYIIAIFIAYNASRTLENFYKRFPIHLVDKVILVDDASKDNTFELAKKLGITAYQNPINLGYGGNMKRALAIALKHGGDVFIDIHPDGEYNPSAIPLALEKVRAGAKFVLGNRFTKVWHPLKHGMYIWKYLPIKFLAFIDNLVLGVDIKDPHQGFRVYTRDMLEKVSFENNANDYLFSFELIVQAVYRKTHISQVPVETHYSGKKRGASLKASFTYSLGTFKVLLLFILAKLGFYIRLFESPRQGMHSRIRYLLDNPQFKKSNVYNP